MNKEYQQEHLNKKHKELIRYGKVVKDISENYTRETIFSYNNLFYLVKMELGVVKETTELDAFTDNKNKINTKDK